MKPIILISEGQSDKLIIETLLPKTTINQIEFVVGQGRYSALSRGRTLLTTRRLPLILAVDADVTEDQPVSELRSMLETLVRDAAGGVPYLLLLFVPCVESLLIPDEQGVKELAGENSISPYEVEFALLQPKRYMQDKIPNLNGDYTKQIIKYLNGLSPQRKARLAENPMLKDVQQFVAENA